jgi:hypothetical protein
MRQEGIVDVSKPPRVVFESPANCADGRKAEDWLRRALTRAQAPGQTWVVTMRVEATRPGLLQAVGEITDDRGTPVGHRELSGKAHDCAGLARAIGVWASLVLDAEMGRAHQGSVTDNGAPPRADNPSDYAALPATADTMPVAPPPATPPDDASTRRDEAMSQEVGAGAFLMTGTGGGAVWGVTPFVVAEVARGIWIRPALAAAESLSSAQPKIIWLAARIDGCVRATGQYTRRRGLALDLCGGVDLGVLSAAAQTLPYAAVGPSLDLRGELGSDLSALLRGLVGVNLLHQDLVDTPPFAARIELAMSWRLK